MILQACCIGRCTDKRFFTACLCQKDDAYCSIHNATPGDTRLIQVAYCCNAVVTNTVNLLGEFFNTLLEDVKWSCLVNQTTLIILKRREKSILTGWINSPCQSLSLCL